jgi:hypothetical protein
MENQQHETYEYARKRILQKKNLLYHFVVLLVGSFFMFIAYYFFDLGAPMQWHIWITTIWAFFFILHFIKIYVTDRFMNKTWERAQIDRLMLKQEQKIAQLQSKIDTENQQ